MCPDPFIIIGCCDYSVKGARHKSIIQDLPFFCDDDRFVVVVYRSRQLIIILRRSMFALVCKMLPIISTHPPDRDWNFGGTISRVQSSDVVIYGHSMYTQVGTKGRRQTGSLIFIKRSYLKDRV